MLRSLYLMLPNPRRDNHVFLLPTQHPIHLFGDLLRLYWLPSFARKRLALLPPSNRIKPLLTLVKPNARHERSQI